MNANEAIKQGMETGQMISMSYVEDLSDEEMMHRPHPECNHIKWQIGHLIASENHMIEGVAPKSMPALPDGFSGRYGKESAASDNPDAFDSKADLLKIYHQQRAGTLAALGKLTEEDLDKAAPEEFQSFAPTVGAAFCLQGNHWLMHAGQWAVIRRQLGRPPLF